MGYLKRKLRRATAAKEATRFERSAIGSTAPGTSAPKGVGFIRLAVDGSGVFQAAYDLGRDPRLGVDVREDLAAHLRWFSAKLKPHAPADAAAVFWFKDDATEHVRKLWGLIHLLQRQGRDVRMWTSRHPGRIVFEDAFQVAAVAYRAGRREKRLTSPRA